MLCIEEKNVVSCPVKPLVSLNLPTEYKAMDIPSAEDGGVMAAFEKSVAELPDEVTVLEKIKIEDYPISLRNQVFVSPDGDDSADGSIDSPLATLDAALKKISGRNGAVI